MKPVARFLVWVLAVALVALPVVAVVEGWGGTKEESLIHTVVWDLLKPCAKV